MKPSATLAALLENFFTQRLMNQRQASPHTISSYRDTFRLLLHFAQQRLPHFWTIWKRAAGLLLAVAIYA